MCPGMPSCAPGDGRCGPGCDRDDRPGRPYDVLEPGCRAASSATRSPRRLARISTRSSCRLAFTPLTIARSRFRLSGTGPALGKTLELCARRKDGVEIAVALSLSGVRLGDRWHAVGILRDITEQQRAQAALQESEERYRTLFHSSRDAMMTLVPPNWTYASANPPPWPCSGWTAKRNSSRCASGQLSPERQPDGRLSLEAAREAIAIAMREGVHFFEWTHRRADGETFPGTILLTRIELGGRSFLQATIRDITDQKQAEEAVMREDARAGDGQSPARSGRRAGDRDGPGRRGGQHREEPVPGQHEPRDPHPDERRHRHDRAAARHRPVRRAARLRRDRPSRAARRC